MDLHLLSNVGFSSGDLDALAADGEVAQVYGAVTETAFLPVGDDAADEIVKVCTLPADMRKAGAAINQPLITEGRLPQSADECLIEVNTPSAFQVGDTLRVVPADAEDTALAVTEYKIVGRADWSMYVDFERGTAQIGNGSIDSFLLVMPEAFDCAYYTDVYLTLTKTADVNSFTDRYLTIAEDEADAISDRTADFAASRAEELREDAEAELADARKELDDGWAVYRDGEKELEDKLADAKKKLDESLALAYETKLVRKLSALTDSIADRTDALESALIALHDAEGIIAESEAIRDDILPKMCELRVACDEAETLTDRAYWPYPTYGDILFSVK
jgi:putative ABC transport system permease protein